MDNDKKKELMAKAEMFAETKDIVQALTANTQTGFQEKMQENSTPDTKEEKQLNKKMRKIWSSYRKNMLEQIDLENYKKFCQIEVERAKTDLELLELKNKKEITQLQHWLAKNKGNLEEIKYNQESKPSKFWYMLNRGLFHLKRTCSNIPKLTWYILAGVCGIAIMYLMSKGIGYLV